MTNNHENAARLLTAIWRGVSADYKRRYRKNIWDQFESNVRSAAYTSNLGKFASSLCVNLQAQIGITNEDRIEAESILNSGNDRALLKLLRDETTLLVLMVRVENQKRQEEWKAKNDSDVEEVMLPGFDLLEKEKEE